MATIQSVAVIVAQAGADVACHVEAAGRNPSHAAVEVFQQEPAPVLADLVLKGSQAVPSRSCLKARGPRPGPSAAPRRPLPSGTRNRAPA